MEYIKSVYDDNDEVHKSRFSCLVKALADEMLICFSIGSLTNQNINKLYEMATNEIFTEYEKNQIIKQACELLEKEKKIKIISTSPLKFQKAL